MVMSDLNKKNHKFSFRSNTIIETTMNNTPHTDNNYNKNGDYTKEEIDTQINELIWKKIRERGLEKERKLFGITIPFIPGWVFAILYLVLFFYLVL